MANLTTVGLTAGAGTSGTGTVSTLDNVIGVAGTPSAQVQTVQGVASMTALKVDGSAVTQPVSIATLPSGAVTNTGTFAVQNTAATPSGTNVIGHVIVDTAPSTAVTNAGTFSVQVSNANANGQATMANSAPVTIASNQATFPVTATSVDQYAKYNTVAASQTAQALTGGGGGASGDYLAYVTVFPGVAASGLVTILDNATTIGTFPGGGTTALPSLVPFTIQIGAFSSSGAWKITTGANVTVAAVGKFT